jgi:UDP-glucose 4-epimerase
MKIAMTGARGRLGRVLRAHFEAAGDEVLAFSRSADAGHEDLLRLPEFLAKGDVDAVLHLAWSTLPATAELDPDAASRCDLPLVESLISVLAERARRGDAARFVFFSTCAVYGEPRPGQVFCENDVPDPKGRYAAGKVAAEQIIERFRAQHALPACVLRVTNPYGFPQDANCPQGVIPAMMAAALRGEAFTVWGRGDAVKDYLHIEDMCAAVDRCVRSNLIGTFNVACGQSRTLQAVAAVVEKAVGRTLKLCYGEAPAWDVQRGRYSRASLKEATGWEPRVEFADGVKGFARALGKRREVRGEKRGE